MADRSLAGQVRSARIQDKVATGVLALMVAAIFLLLVALIAYLLYKGAGKALDIDFLTAAPQQFKEGGGIGPEIFNSFYLLVLTLLISLPLSLGAAVFLAEYAPDNVATRAIKTIIEVLSSLPSIVVGLFGFLFFVVKMGWGFSILSGALALTMFNIPCWCASYSRRSRPCPRTSATPGWPWASRGLRPRCTYCYRRPCPP